jgi:hypothetical protein
MKPKLKLLMLYSLLLGGCATKADRPYLCMTRMIEFNGKPMRERAEVCRYLYEKRNKKEENQGVAKSHSFRPSTSKL